MDHSKQLLDNGTGTGSYSDSIGALSPNTTYYVRAYATNSQGTTYGSVVGFTTDEITVLISPTSPLTEKNLDANSLSVALLGTTFTDSTLDASNFTLNNAPSGATIESVTYINTENCTVNLAYDGTNFDSNVTNLSLTIAAVELSSGSALTSNIFTITATVETTPTVHIQVNISSATTATMGGTVIEDGGASVIGRGVVYSSTDATPTIGEAGVTQEANGTGTGEFSKNIIDLTPNTTYYVRSYATNSVGTSYSLVINFNTPPAAPTTTTGAASNISSTTAALNGIVNANGASTTVTFENGTTISYGSTAIVSQSPFTGTTNTSVSGSISGLAPYTTYHFQVKSANSKGTTYGSDQTFTTSAIAPTAVTNVATNIVSDAATLNGTVNSNNAQAIVTFEYGTTISYGSIVTASQSPVTGLGNTSVSCNITDLTPNTTYYYRVKAENDGGTTYGSEKTFSTDVTAPTILSASRTDDTHITVTLSEACQSLIKANNGGFTVTMTGTATTFAVSATAQEADTSHVVLTVADTSIAGAMGVTVTYTSGGNGTIADTTGNELETTTTGANVTAWDTDVPTVNSINRSSP